MSSQSQTTVVTRRYLLPISKEELKARNFEELKYTAIRAHLIDNGWRPQEQVMQFPNAAQNDQRVEWWNRGPEVLLVWVDSDNRSAILFRPTSRRVAVSAVTKKRKETR